ncbi:transcriptional regulator TyrR [Psychrobium sp. MM17-31]|uniref:transcriptional regulator TyrR n=1 Tax=Psychrobium sp. MM17-31 TaxID=2917758 RepID=UPI001EF6E3BD|nr:transcriptional regulator TyrR [Psychrobium sp. MM17-31]
MRLEVLCENRLGIAQEILGLLASFNLNLRGIDADQTGRVYVHFPEIEFSDFQKLMQSIRKIVGVNDVRAVSHMPSEQEHYGLLTLLKNLPDPIFSIDLKGQITRANDAALKLIGEDESSSDKEPLNNWVSGFSFSKWLASKDVSPLASRVSVEKIEYLAEIIPVYLPDVDDKKIVTGAVILLKSSQRIDKQYNALKSAPENSFANVLAFSPAMKEVVATAKQHAVLDAPLLISGDTGTGKEVLARACHEHSDRRDKPFIAINCAAIPDEVAESELFGYAPNSVSKRLEGKQGLIEKAQGGTLFFDEIAEMTPLMQVKLVRLIESNKFRRVGGDEEVTVDIRIICASQQDLSQLIQTGKFREDLYYRINVLQINLLPLLQRKQDIIPLAETFLAYYALKLNSSAQRLSIDAKRHIQDYSWPGNIRQLKNAIYRGVSQSLDAIEVDVAELELPSYSKDFGYYDCEFEGTLDQATKQFEANLLKRLYPAYPSTRLLAKKLGVSHTAIANKLRDYGINKNTLNNSNNGES